METSLRPVLRLIDIVVVGKSIQKIRLTKEGRGMGDLLINFPNNKIPRFLMAVHDTKGRGAPSAKWISYRDIVKFLPDDMPPGYKWTLLKLDHTNEGGTVWLPFLEGR